MTRVGAIDCGTNSIRLLVADLTDGRLSDLHRENRVVRLGQGVDKSRRLAPEALDRTRRALQAYTRTCQELGVERTRLIATSATRDADNREDFRAMVLDVLGVEPEVITGDEEAELSFEGATRGLDPRDGPFLVMDIGGGSTEVVLGTEKVTAALSVDAGCVRLTERHLRDDPPTDLQIEAAEAELDVALSRIRAAVPVDDARTAVGVAGSVTTIAALALGLSSYDASKIHLSRISAADIRRQCEVLLKASWAERLALPVMHPGRVDVIGAGALILRTLVDRFGLAELLVSEADILDGTAWSLS